MTAVQVPDRLEDEIARMMREHGAFLLRLCFLSLQDRGLAEDAVQDTFVKAYKGWHQFRKDSSEKTWLCRIATNTCRDYHRRNWFIMMKAHVSLDQAPEPIVPFDEMDDTLTKALMNLPYRYRETILLHYYQGLPVGEVALILNLKPTAIYARLRRGQQMLKPVLERWYHNEE